MKQVTLHPLQLEAILNGAMLMAIKIPVDDNLNSYVNKDYYIENYRLPLKQGDEIYIAEEFRLNEYGDIEYKTSKFTTPVVSPLNAFQWQPASDITYKQSRLRFTVGEVVVKRADDITIDDAKKLTNLYYREVLSINANDWLKAQDIEPTDYVALVEIKE